MADKLEITAIFLGERFRFSNADGDTIIGDIQLANGSASTSTLDPLDPVNLPTSVKGRADIDELVPHQTYTFDGRWTIYKNKRSGEQSRQFVFDHFVQTEPHGREGVITYLCQAGEGHGIGSARATLLWQKFGSDAINVLCDTPEIVADLIPGLPLEKAQQASAWLHRNRAMRDSTVQVIELLAGRGFSKHTAKRAITVAGVKTAQFIRRDPFWLLKFPTCGAKKCDAMYTSLGLNPARLKRQAIHACYALEADNNGHTWFPVEVAIQGIRDNVGGVELREARAIKLAKRAKKLVTLRTDSSGGTIVDKGGRLWVSPCQKASKESKLSQLIADAITEPHEWPDALTVPNIDQEQPAVLAKALQGPIAILGGRPGAGKTRVTANLIKVLIDKFGEDEIGIGAPTNMAAKRLTEVMATWGVGLQARTWHSLLGRPRVRGHEWDHDESNPFPFKVLIGDEQSMTELEIMTAIFSARAKGTHFLLVGDVHQLPPVGHGAPLRDLIAAGLPYGELREIRRNSGGIVEACSAIVDGRPWGPGDNLEIIPINDEQGQIAEVIRQLKLCGKSGLDPIWDTRVIVPRNETRVAMNKAIQAEMNPRPGIVGSPFKLGDKIISVENTDYKVVEAGEDDYESGSGSGEETTRVAKGELAKVVQVNDKYFIAKLFSPHRMIRIPRGTMRKDGDQGNQDGGDGANSDKTSTGCDWNLAYAITFHSSQGSQFPWSILVASTRDGRMGCRELVYTGISRAQDKCKMIGLKSVWDKMCRRVAINDRKTFLKELIHLKTVEKVLVEL